MTQVEDPGALPPGLHQLIDPTIQHRTARAQQEGVERTLDRLEGLNPLADLQRTGGVQRHGLDVALRRITLCKRRRASWEADERHGDPQGAGAGHKRLVRLQDQGFEQIVGQALGPALEDLQHLGAGVLLHLQIMGGGLDQNLQQGRDLFRFGIGIGSGRSALALHDRAGFAVQHIGGHGPGGAGEADQGLGRIQFSTHQAQGLAHRLQGLPRPGGQLPHLVHRRQGAEARTFAGFEPDLLTQGARDQQNISEDDSGVEAEAAHGLKRSLGRHLRIHAEGDEVRRLGPQLTVLGQVAPGLTHEPHGRTGRSLALESLDQKRSAHALGFRMHTPKPQSLFKNKKLKELEDGSRALDSGDRIRNSHPSTGFSPFSKERIHGPRPWCVDYGDNRL